MRSSSSKKVFSIVGLAAFACLSACTILGGGDDSSSATADGGDEDVSNGRRDAGHRTDSGSSSPSSSDSGTVRHDDAGHVIGPDGGALVCEPGSLSGFSGGTYKTPITRTNVCTATDLTNYTSCVNGSDSTQCAQFAAGGASATCGSCLLTPKTATHWGPTIGTDAPTSSLNIPGCLALVFGEGSSTTGCGGTLQKDFNCQDTPCDLDTNCAGTTQDVYDTCINDAISGECSSYASAAQTACTKDAGGADAVCNVSDATTFQAFLAYFCGGG